MKSKIVILSTVNLKHMTLSSLFTSILDKYSIPYDILHIDKYFEDEPSNALNVYSYKLKIIREWKFTKKLIKYFSFRKFAKNIISKNSYEIIIVWNSLTALMFIDLLILKYRKKYIINIRDYNFEKIPLIYLLLKILVKNSLFTTISSKGFYKFLPKYDYVNVQSLNLKILEQNTPRNSTQKVDVPIKITFIGYVRFFDNDKKLIDLLGNDNRFQVQFFGEGSHYLKEYSDNKGYHNIVCIGRFESSETASFLENTDIINNLYGCGSIELDTAISIKSYYSAYMKMPILVFKNTYMEEFTNGFNYVCDFNNSSFADDLYNWYRNIDFNELSKACDTFIFNAIKDNNNFEDLFIESVLRKGNYI